MSGGSTGVKLTQSGNSGDRHLCQGKTSRYRNPEGMYTQNPSALNRVSLVLYFRLKELYHKFRKALPRRGGRPETESGWRTVGHQTAPETGQEIWVVRVRGGSGPGKSTSVETDLVAEKRDQRVRGPFTETKEARSARYLTHRTGRT